ncbi:ATP-binding protein [Pengzhenrongella sp.]|jgi:anti-sigma regulatory factor (Ser/Thr protein kinase)|uniref:ATP-binding protein n=1 Tax=Pengzhenrongella sp. TaxID=2888820 RepID=UPI002F956CE6
MGDRDERRARLAGRAHAPLRSVRGGGQGAPGTDELRLPARPSSARLARDWVMNKLAADGVFGAENQVVELLTGELVANAALHGPPDGLVRVRAWRIRRTVRVAVRDDSSQAPVVLHSGPSATSGRGLALVDTLAADWGIERHGSRGKTVWFSVDLDQG